MEKSFNKIQHLFMMDTLGKLGRKKHFISLIKGMYKKAKANEILNDETLNDFPLRSLNAFSLKEQSEDIHPHHF